MEVHLIVDLNLISDDSKHNCQAIKEIKFAQLNNTFCTFRQNSNQAHPLIK